MAHHIKKVMDPPIVSIARNIAKFHRKDQKLITFGQGVPFYSPHEKALEELKKELNNHTIHKYTVDEGEIELRETNRRIE